MRKIVFLFAAIAAATLSGCSMNMFAKARVPIADSGAGRTAGEQAADTEQPPHAEQHQDS
ncbi:MAG TPA: hypothetical protein VM141_04765 [Planctomycetota bacterium]|nr:hypothetical protein [Planctomycetota bacterium]